MHLHERQNGKDVSMRFSRRYGGVYCCQRQSTLTSELGYIAFRVALLTGLVRLSLSLVVPGQVKW